MNKFIYTSARDASTIPSEMVINPVAQIAAGYMTVHLRFHFTVGDLLTDVQTMEIPFAQQRACDLVGTCLTFSKLTERVYICEYPYMKEGAIWLDLAVDLTTIPLSSADLLNLYSSYFTSTDAAKLIAKLRQQE